MIEAKKAGKLRYIGLTGHKDHASLTEGANGRSNLQSTRSICAPAQAPVWRCGPKDLVAIRGLLCFAVGYPTFLQGQKNDANKFENLRLLWPIIARGLESTPVPICGGGSLASLALAPEWAHAEGVPTIAYDSVPDLLKLPDNLFLGEVSGVAINSKGHIFVLTRSGTTGPAYASTAAQLLEFDAEGRFLREIGHNLYAWSFAHTVKIDSADNIWVTDKGSDMVIKFTPAGRVAMVFGRKQEAADESTGPLKHPNPPLPAIDGYFRQVTDVAWDAAGNSYISDGYINSRVAKVDKDGNWLKSWGERGKGPGQFHTPHSIAVDAKGEVYVADRSNRRIQVFDEDGGFIRQMTIDVPVPADARPAIGNMPDEGVIAAGTFAPGSPWAICISPGPNQVLYCADAFPGRIYKMTLDGKLLGMLGRSGKQLKQFGWIHEISCPSENVLFVAELLNWRIQKLVLQT